MNAGNAVFWANAHHARDDGGMHATAATAARRLVRQSTHTRALWARSTVAAAFVSSTNAHERRSSAGVSAAGLLLLLLCATASDVREARCEALSRLEPTNRRHTGTSPQKNLSASESKRQEHDASSDLLEPATGVYFDAEYDAKGFVGAGSFGVVLQCVRKQDGCVAAVKMVPDLGPSTRAEVARETAALVRVQQQGGHDAIVRFNGAYAHDGFHYIVTEYVAGESLFAFLTATTERQPRQPRRGVGVHTALQIVAQLADALAFLQQNGLVHRDLKPENVMVLDKNGKNDSGNVRVKLIDFGSAGPVADTRRFCPERADSDALSPPLSGTRCYWSPEVLLRQELSPAMDMWALGCLLYILLSGRHPFDLMGSATEEQVVERVVSPDCVSFAHPLWAAVPSDVKALVRGLLEKDPHKRLTVHDVLAHASVKRACRSHDDTVDDD